MQKVKLLRKRNVAVHEVMESYLLKGIIIGLIFGIPAGAVGAMAIQRTLSRGVKAGLVTGLGSSAADCLYAVVGAFGLTLISDFLLQYQVAINIIGGTFILFMGIRLIMQKNMEIMADRTADKTEKHMTKEIKMFLTSFAVGITNPAAILTFLFAFSYFGITGQTGLLNGIKLVLGVFIGTGIWWCLLSMIVSMVKRKTKNHSLSRMNKIFGAVLIIFGALVFIRTFY